MTPQREKERDGFAIRDFDGNEIRFVVCEHGGRVREKVLRGILVNCRDDLIVADTREETPDD